MRLKIEMEDNIGKSCHDGKCHCCLFAIIMAMYDLIKMDTIKNLTYLIIVMPQQLQAHLNTAVNPLTFAFIVCMEHKSIPKEQCLYLMCLIFAIFVHKYVLW